MENIEGISVELLVLVVNHLSLIAHLPNDPPHHLRTHNTENRGAHLALLPQLLDDADTQDVQHTCLRMGKLSIRQGTAQLPVVCCYAPADVGQHLQGLQGQVNQHAFIASF
jgi:hypothetical protein